MYSPASFAKTAIRGSLDRSNEDADGEAVETYGVGLLCEDDEVVVGSAQSLFPSVRVHGHTRASHNRTRAQCEHPGLSGTRSDTVRASSPVETAQSRHGGVQARL